MSVFGFSWEFYDEWDADAGVFHFAFASGDGDIVPLGFDWSVGAVVAGLLLGLSEVWAQAYAEPLLGRFGRNIHTVLPYIIMVLFLIVRPHGLFGKADVERL